MADYLPLQVLEIREVKTDEGEIRKSAVCRTVQPEQFNLNLSRLDAARLQRFNDNIGNIIMVPVRRGEINGRAYTSIADGHIFRDSEVVATFELSDSNKSPKVQHVQPETNLTVSSETTEKSKPLFGNKAA